MSKLSQNSLLTELILAMRPWSFTASIIPVLITAAVTKSQFLSLLFLRALTMGVFIQAGANLTNTYFDFLNGVDTKQHNADPTLVENRLSPTILLFLTAFCYLVGILAILPLLVTMQGEIAVVFSIGVTLAFFYTASPVGLKYKAFGDITIFLCFGPLLMQCASLILTGKMNENLILYTVPVGLLTEAILHTNNARDIDADTRAGAVTLACLLGFDGSYIFCQFLIYGAYISTFLIAAFYHYGCLLPLLTLPLGLDILKKFHAKQMSTLTEDTAKMHLPFGIALLIGIITTSKGLLAAF